MKKIVIVLVKYIIQIGFFFQIFNGGSECKVIAEIKEYNNCFANIPCKIVTCKSIEEREQILIIMHEKDKIKDVTTIDATDNNMKWIKDMIEKGKSEFNVNEHE